MDPLASRTVGPYRLVASLGRGGQADVYLAVRRGPAGFSKLIVIKSIRHELEHDPGSRDALIAEARLAARLQHPNIVQTLDVGDESGQLYMAMEFLDGQPLSKLVRVAAKEGRQIELPIVAAILSEMLAGLNAAHELRDYDGRSLEVIHRDVSPQNVFLTYEGEIKLVDFGIAKTAAGGEVTAAGIIKGKAGYMAPEQALGQALDRRADLYAAGIIAWELFGGRRFFPGDAPIVPDKARLEPAREVPSLPAGIAPAVAAVVEKALARDRERRFATAKEMREALEAALAQSGIRKAGREEVGRFVAGVFEKDRRWLQQRIRESIAAAEQETPSGNTLPNLKAELPTAPTLTRRASRLPRVLALAAGLAAAAFLGFLLWPRSPAGLRLCGSGTVGEGLAPALVEAFLKRKPGLKTSIEAAGTATAFKGLAAGTCDVGMASRAMSDDEARGFGDLRAPATEHVIALDGIAVIVHPDNQVRSLDTDQVKAVFAGAVKDWSALGGAAGPIEVDALDEQSTTLDTFKHVVLGSQPIAGGARRFDDSSRLSDRVATEPGAIGFVGLAYVRSARAIAISAQGSAATLPSPFTVAGERYPLSRRLYLYTRPRQTTAAVIDFVDFVLSNDGQQVVREKGFVDLAIASMSLDACDKRCPADYAAATRGARRLTLDFRFREASGSLDSRAIRDLDRLVAFLRGSPPSRLLLLGFDVDREGSLESAKQVASEMERRGVKAAVVAGFGAAMPISSRNDAGGRQRNHRVEVWIAESSR